MAITSAPFEHSVHYSAGHRQGSIEAMAYAADVARCGSDDTVFKNIVAEGLRRYQDDFRTEAEKRGIKL